MENRIEVPDGSIFATDHEAVSALESPDAATGAAVDVVDTLRGKLAGAAAVVAEVRVAAVDDDVVFFEMGDE